jgi:hypothetical protein
VCLEYIFPAYLKSLSTKIAIPTTTIPTIAMTAVTITISNINKSGEMLEKNKLLNP